MVAPRSQSDLMADPGAYASTQIPQFEYDAFASVFSEAATVNTPLAPAGDALLAPAPSVPPPPATNTPDLLKFVTPSFLSSAPSTPTCPIATASGLTVSRPPLPSSTTSLV